ncbi:MAG: hypothetical protein ACYTFW_07285 [Planctomycetota bacterium]
MIRSYNTLVICAVMFFAIGLIQPNTAVAQSSPAEELVTVLPDDVMGFVTTSGGDSLKPAFEKAILGRLWNDPAVQSFYQSIKKELLSKMEKEINDPDARGAVDMIQNFARLALSRPIIIGAAQKAATEGPPIYGFVILDAGSRKAEIASALTKLEVLAGDGDIIEVDIGSLKMHGPKHTGDVPGYWGWVGNHLVFAINDGQGLAIKYLQNSRSAAPDYLKNVPGSGDAIAIHIDCQKIAGMVNAIAEQEGATEQLNIASAAIKELGLNSVKTLTARAGFSGPDLVSNGLLEIPQPRTGLFENIKKINLSTLDVVDARAVNAFAINCDTAGMYDTIMQAVKTAVPNDAYLEIQEGIANFEYQVNFNIRKGLLESLSGPKVIYTLPAGISMEAPTGGIVLIAGLKDAALWEKSMTALENFATAVSNNMLQVSTQAQPDGRTLHSWVIAPLAMMQVMPCWTVVDNHLVISSNTALCKIAIDQMTSASAGTKSIRTTEGYKKVTARLPDNLIALTYTDSKVQFNQMMIGLQQFWPMISMFAKQADVNLPAMLPSVAHIINDMGPSCRYAWFDAQGLRSHYRGVGIEPGLGAVAGGAMGAGILMPALARARLQARQTVSMTNLKQLGLTLIMYADDHQDTLPENLEQAKEYYRDSKMFESPLKPASFTGPSYIYVKGHSLKAESPARMIVVYENPGYCQDTINALFLDGHVEKMKRDRFLEALEETYQGLGRDMPEIKFKDS